MCKIRVGGIRVSSSQARMRNLRQTTGRVGEIAAKVERAILVIFVSMILLIVFLGVIVRYTPISGHTLWTAELARFFLLWASFWAAGAVERVGGHFRFDMFENLFRGKTLLFLQLFIKFVLLVSMGILIWWTIVYCGVARGLTTLNLQWPAVIRVIPLLLGSLLLFTHCLIGFIRNLLRWREGC